MRNYSYILKTRPHVQTMSFPEKIYNKDYKKRRVLAASKISPWCSQLLIAPATALNLPPLSSNTRKDEI